MDVSAVLEKLSELGYIRLNRVIGDYYSIYCPFHNDGNEKKPSFGVLMHDQWKNGEHYEEGWCHCFTCGHTDSLVNTIQRILTSHSVTTSSIDWLKDNVPGFEIHDDFQTLIPDNLVRQLTNSFALDYINKKLDRSPVYVSEDELRKYRYTVPYMYERKLTDEIIELYDVGFDVNWIPPGRKQPVPCITFPVNDIQGNTLFIARRSIQGKLFNYPQGVSKPVYGLDKLPPGTKSVVICESIFNSLTAVVYGYPAVALLGTGNAQQLQQLKRLGVSEYVIAMDGDEAGRRAANRLKSALKSVGMVWVIDMPDGKDVNDCSKEEFDELYANRS